MSRFLTTAKAKVCEHRSFHTRVVEIEDSEDEAPLKLPTNCLKMSFLNLKPGLDQPTEVS